MFENIDFALFALSIELNLMKDNDRCMVLYPTNTELGEGVMSLRATQPYRCFRLFSNRPRFS